MKDEEPPYELRERTKLFGLRTVRLFVALPKTDVARRDNHGRFDGDKEWGFGDGGHGEGGDIRIKSVEGGQKKGGGGAGRGGPGRPPRGLG